jgi:hypothetical protein
MTEAYRTSALADAIAERDAAQARFAQALPGTKQWHAAGDDLQFWGNKVAFLHHAKTEAV